MQKFEESDEPLSDRKNIIVMADEAHRGQYGLTEKIKTSRDEQGNLIAHRTIGTARIIRNSLPNASYIGFTGTPISREDRSTIEVFGDYIDVYDMTQAVEDGATRPVYYESRVIKLKLDDKVLAQIDAEYSALANNADEEVIEKSKHELGKMEEILGHEKTINSLVYDILNHYENERQYLYTGKAMIVAYNRSIAMKVFNRILELRPSWAGTTSQVTVGSKQITVPGDDARIAVVMTESNKDPEEWRAIIGNKTHRQELASRFKDNNSPLKIVIVVDMWLTGFDVPSLDTIYIFKPIQKHTLIQTISRVNRTYKGKEKGLVVDYIGIKKAMNEALKKYTDGEQEEFEDSGKAVVIVKDQLSVVNAMFNKFDASLYYNGTPFQQLKTLNKAVEYIQFNEELEKRFMEAAHKMKKAFNLCSTSESFSDDEKNQINFYIAVRAILFKLTKGDAPDIATMNNHVSKLIQEAIKSDGVEELFQVGRNVNFDLFSYEYLEKINRLLLPNTKIKILEQLLRQAIGEYKKTNKIKATEFSERLNNLIIAYNNRFNDGDFASKVLDDVAEQLNQLFADMMEDKKSFEAMGIDFEEKAFYDILVSCAKRFNFEDQYPKMKMIELAKKVKFLVAQNVKYTDWNLRLDVKAEMKADLRILLDENGYPPVPREEVFKEVFDQAENFKKYEE